MTTAEKLGIERENVAAYDMSGTAKEQRLALIRALPWRDRVAIAVATGSFTREDRMLALCWCTCAVGEQHLRVPEVVVLVDSVPMDDTLTGLGSCYTGFAAAVVRDHVGNAEKFLDAIEDRVLELKRAAGS